MVSLLRQLVQCSAVWHYRGISLLPVRDPFLYEVLQPAVPKSPLQFTGQHPTAVLPLLQASPHGVQPAPAPQAAACDASLP